MAVIISTEIRLPWLTTRGLSEYFSEGDERARWARLICRDLCARLIISGRGDGLSYDGYIRRIAALLLLVFALADISSTDICSGKLELLGFSDEFIANFTGAGTGSALTAVSVEAAGQSQSSQSIPEDDDCFCWCPHVLPTLVFSFDTLIIEAPAVDLINTSMKRA